MFAALPSSGMTTEEPMTAQIDREHLTASLCQRLELIAPTGRRCLEPGEQHHGIAGGVSGLGALETNTVISNDCSHGPIQAPETPGEPCSRGDIRVHHAAQSKKPLTSCSCW